MDNNIASLGLSSSFAAPRNTGPDASSQQRPQVNDLLAPASQNSVELNRDIPATSQIPEVNNQLETRTNQTNRAEERTDPIAQQRQIESFLAEQTGENEETFRGIDIQTALDLQESFRERPAQSDQSTIPSQASNQSSPEPVDANDQQTQELQQRLQSRLAEQLPNDPGTEFPQLIETVA